ncbi:methionine import ATP-binding protein MetN 1 [Clostridia bacterium]|nr:methionine import ATP-binding protein MetN 1 [Clostridia bacterium]
MIKIDNVYKTYRSAKASVEALKDVSVTINTGIVYGVIGYSGSGKSTLIRCINQLEKIDSGSITVNGEDIVHAGDKELRSIRRKIGMIFQHFNLLKNDTVYSNIALPLQYERISKKTIDARVDELLDIVGLTDKRSAYPSQLSGGQQQRVAIARSLANNPDYLLCDEATSALDPDSTAAILALLRELNQKLKLTVVVITHEMGVLKDICDEVAVLHNGVIVEQGLPEELFAHPNDPITKRFSNSLFEHDKVRSVLEREQTQAILNRGGIAARLLFRGDVANKALISDVSRRFNIDVGIIFGTVEMFKGDPLGNLYVTFDGDNAKINDATKYIESLGVIIEQVGRGA